MKDRKFLTLKEVMERYNVTYKKALSIADQVQTAPRAKGEKIYVLQAAADAFMGV